MTMHESQFHDHLQRHPNLIRLAIEFEQLTPENHPDQVGRVSLKEDIIVQIADIIHRNYIPFIFLAHAPGHGLKAGLLRVLGEHGNADHLGLIETVAASTRPGQSDLNLKWQIVRAYRSMHFRQPTEPRIAISATNVIPVLMDGADTSLVGGVAAMKEKLAIA